MKKLLADNLTEDCYPDKGMRTLTIDFGFYISRQYGKKAKEEEQEEPQREREWRRRGV